MKRIEFTKMVASGNDFIIVDSLIRYSVVSWSQLARQICGRKYGVGADGLLVLEGSKSADIKMRLFNADGSEAEMCGNGARCVALWAKKKAKRKKQKEKIETKAGIIKAQVSGEHVKIRLTEPKGIKIDMPLSFNYRKMRLNFINTGVPHAVIFVEGLDKIDVAGLGRQIRNHKSFSPQGTNVDFVEVLSNQAISLRTYERGVEDETLACGTGAVASALVTSCKLGNKSPRNMKVQTRGKEVLTVYFKKRDHTFKDVWLEGKAAIVCKGVYYV